MATSGIVEEGVARPDKPYIRYHRGDAAARQLEFHKDTRKDLFIRKVFEPQDGRAEVLESGESPRESLKKRAFCLTNLKSSVADQLLKIDNMSNYSPDPRKPVKVESEESKRIRGVYFAEVTEMVREMTGAEHCFCLSYATRYGQPDTLEGNRYLTSYATFAHCDYSERFLDKKLKLLSKRGFGLDEVESHDIAFYNVWQPVENVVQQNPLALLDWQTLAAHDPEDVINTPLGYHVTKSTVTGDFEKPEVTLLSAEHAEEHRWFYFPRMKPTEALLFTQLDPRDNFATRCYHTSFFDTTAPQNVPPRKSIELRFVCAFPKSGATRKAAL